MKTDDFRYMWRGKNIEMLEPKDAKLLKGINQRSNNKTKALLLLHGFSSSPAVYRKILPNISIYDAIVCPTLPGHGESIQAFSKVKAQHWLTIAKESCQELTKEYQYVDVLGLSLGGILALAVSAEFNINHLYLLAPALELKLNLKTMLYLSKILNSLGFHKLRNRAGNIHTKGESELAYRQVPIKTIIEILSFIDNFNFIPPKCPTDLFLGYHDAVVDSVKVAKYFNNLANCKIHWLNNSAHVLPLDGDIEQIITRVVENY